MPLLQQVRRIPRPAKGCQNINRDTIEEAQAIFQTKGIAHAEMGIELDEARRFLHQLYDMVLDQVLSEQDIGSPLFMNIKKGKCSNTFFNALYQRFDGNATSAASFIPFASKERFLITPEALEKELKSLLNKTLFDFAEKYYGMALLRLGGGFAGSDKEKKTLELARQEMPEVKKLGELWDEVAGLLVRFLAIRHEERFMKNDAQ